MCVHTLYYWKLQLGSQKGHVALKLSNGTYISHWPTSWTNKTAKQIESPEKEIETEGDPDGTLDIPDQLLDKDKIVEWWTNCKPDRYNFATNNCAHIAASAIEEGIGCAVFQKYFGRPDSVLKKPEQVYFPMRTIVWLFHASNPISISSGESPVDLIPHELTFIRTFFDQLETTTSLDGTHFPDITFLQYGSILQSMKFSQFLSLQAGSSMSDKDFDEIDEKCLAKQKQHLATYGHDGGQPVHLSQLWLFRLLTELHVHLQMYENVYRNFNWDEQTAEEMATCLAKIYVSSIRDQKYAESFCSSIFWANDTSTLKPHYFNFNPETNEAGEKGSNNNKNEMVSFFDLHFHPIPVFFVGGQKPNQPTNAWTAKNWTGSRTSKLGKVKDKSEYAFVNITHLRQPFPSEWTGFEAWIDDNHQKTPIQNPTDPKKWESYHPKDKLTAAVEKTTSLEIVDALNCKKTVSATTIQFLYNFVQTSTTFGLIKNSQTIEIVDVEKLSSIYQTIRQTAQDFIREAKMSFSTNTVLPQPATDSVQGMGQNNNNCEDEQLSMTTMETEWRDKMKEIRKDDYGEKALRVLNMMVNLIRENCGAQYDDAQGHTLLQSQVLPKNITKNASSDIKDGLVMLRKYQMVDLRDSKGKEKRIHLKIPKSIITLLQENGGL